MIEAKDFIGKIIELMKNHPVHSPEVFESVLVYCDYLRENGKEDWPNYVSLIRDVLGARVKFRGSSKSVRKVKAFLNESSVSLFDFMPFRHWKMILLGNIDQCRIRYRSGSRHSEQRTCWLYFQCGLINTVDCDAHTWSLIGPQICKIHPVRTYRDWMYGFGFLNPPASSPPGGRRIVYSRAIDQDAINRMIPNHYETIFAPPFRDDESANREVALENRVHLACLDWARSEARKESS